MDIKRFIDLCYNIQTVPILNNPDTRLFSYNARFSDLIWSLVEKTTNKTTVWDMVYGKIRKTWHDPDTAFSDTFFRNLIVQNVVNFPLLNVTLQYGYHLTQQSQIVSCSILFLLLSGINFFRMMD